MSTATPAREMAGPASRRAALRVGFLAQENLPVPPPVAGGSVARVVDELARALVPDTQVCVCSLPHPTVPEGLSAEGVRFLRVEGGAGGRRQRLSTEAARVLRRLDLPYREPQGMARYAHGYAVAGLRRLGAHDPDIVHVQNVSQHLALAAALVPRARRVLHMHCDWLCQLPHGTAARRLRHADLVLGVSDHITNRIRARFPGLACETLHNGVDIARFAPAGLQPEAVCERSRRLRGTWSAAGGPVVLYVGCLAPEKGVHILLEAFRLQLRDTPDATLVLVGNPNRYFQVAAPRGRRVRREVRIRQRGYVDELAALAVPLGERVVFAGGIGHDEMPAAYLAADVAVMPSTGDEPFPLPGIEAFASGLPVVATDRGGLPELVSDGRTGRLVPGGDPARLAAALAVLCGDPALARCMGAAARREAVERFDWSVRATVLRGYYEELVERRPPDSGRR